jgi:hypothetical protein
LKGLNIHGQHFRTTSGDEGKTIQDSIILCEFIMKPSQDDSNEELEDYVGVIEHILEIWFGASQRRPLTSIKIDEYGFSIFDCTKSISNSTKFGNPYIEASRIRQAYTCVVDTEGSNEMIVVETIPHHPGLFRRDIPRLQGTFLDCDMKEELTLLPATKSGGKTIRYSTKSKPRDYIHTVKEREPSKATTSTGVVEASTSIGQDIEEDHEPVEDEDIEQEIIFEVDDSSIPEGDAYAAEVEVDYSQEGDIENSEEMNVDPDSKGKRKVATEEHVPSSSHVPSKRARRVSIRLDDYIL